MFSFVAKRELADQWIAGLFLRKLGARFVERFDLQRSAADTELLAEALQAGQSLVDRVNTLTLSENTAHQDKRGTGLSPKQFRSQRAG